VEPHTYTPLKPTLRLRLARAFHDQEAIMATSAVTTAAAVPTVVLVLSRRAAACRRRASLAPGHQASAQTPSAAV
jgi:hypothetical protein